MDNLYTMCKNLLIALICLFSLTLSKAQVFQWGMEIQSPLSYYVEKVRSDSAGNVYLLGTHITDVELFSSTVQYTHSDTVGGGKMFLAKLDPSGSPLWVKSWGGGNGLTHLRIGDMEIDRDQRLYIACHYGGLVDLDPGPGVQWAGSNDSTVRTPIVSMLNLSGDLLRYDELDRNILPGIDLALDPTGNLFLTGVYTDSIDVDPDTSQTQWLPGSVASNHQFVSKWDPAGQHLWSYANQSWFFNSVGIHVDDWGNAYPYGTMNDQIFFGSAQGPAGSFSALPSLLDSKDGFVQKVSANGVAIWGKGIEAPEDNEVLSIATDNLGNVYWLGHYEGSLDLDPGPGSDSAPNTGPGEFYSYLIKLDSLGQYTWGRVTEGGGIVRGLKLGLDPDGFIYTMGHYSSEVDLDPGPLPLIAPPHGGYSAFAQALDQNGNFVEGWTTQGGALVTYLGIDIAVPIVTVFKSSACCKAIAIAVI